ncbi:hypothetical protein N0V82_010114 [Gnomoniopsis sp. IMI 355080]|nr:hypothetical protein N0V82_010114 [Gnomoniopsis sp. IMI 355080]
MRRRHERKEHDETSQIKANGAETLGDEIDAATANPPQLTKISLKSIVLAYVRHPSPEGQGSTNTDGEDAASEGSDGEDFASEEDADSEDGAVESAVDIDWSSAEQQLLDQARRENPKMFDLVQNHFGLYKTVFRFMHCLPSDIVGPKTFLEFGSSITASVRWTMHFCERLGELVPQPLFSSSPLKLALAIQWTVICRTKDQRRYRLSGCENDGFLQTLASVIADKQDGTKTCIKLRKIALKRYRKRYPGEGFAEPQWCQFLRLIEELAFPDGPPVDKAPDSWDDPYLVHTQDITTVYTALDRIRHLSLRMFTDANTVHATVSMVRRGKDLPLKPEARKAWEAHMIVWQREKASRGSQTQPPRQTKKADEAGPSGESMDQPEGGAESASNTNQQLPGVEDDGRHSPGVPPLGEPASPQLPDAEDNGDLFFGDDTGTFRSDELGPQSTPIASRPGFGAEDEGVQSSPPPLPRGNTPRPDKRAPDTTSPPPKPCKKRGRILVSSPEQSDSSEHQQTQYAIPSRRRRRLNSSGTIPDSVVEEISPISGLTGLDDQEETESVAAPPTTSVPLGDDWANDCIRINRQGHGEQMIRYTEEDNLSSAFDVKMHIGMIRNCSQDWPIGLPQAMHPDTATRKTVRQ